MKHAFGAAPYVAPFLLFMLFLMAVDGFLPDQHYLLYPIKIALVTCTLAWYWRELPSLRPTSPGISFILGVVGVVLWIGLSPEAMRLDALIETAYNRGVFAIGLGSSQADVDRISPIGRDPFQLYPAGFAWLLFAFRVAGIALVVPIMEELFWRGFLMRWLIAEKFTEVPLGTYTTFSFWATTVCFSLVHGPEWPLAVVVGVIYGYWFVRTKSLGNVMVAHGVTNLLLAFYCLISGDWHFLSTLSPVHQKSD